MGFRYKEESSASRAGKSKVTKRVCRRWPVVPVSTAAKDSAGVGEGLGTPMDTRRAQSSDCCINLCNVSKIIFDASGLKPMKSGGE